MICLSSVIVYALASLERFPAFGKSCSSYGHTEFTHKSRRHLELLYSPFSARRGFENFNFGNVDANLGPNIRPRALSKLAVVVSRRQDYDDSVKWSKRINEEISANTSKPRLLQSLSTLHTKSVHRPCSLLEIIKFKE